MIKCSKQEGYEGMNMSIEKGVNFCCLEIYIYANCYSNETTYIFTQYFCLDLKI